MKKILFWRNSGNFITWRYANMKTTIGIKIGFAFFILLLLFGVMGTKIFYSVSDGASILEQIKEDSRKQIKAGNLRFGVTQVLTASNDYIITNKEYYIQEYQKQNALLDKNYQDFIQSGLTDKEKQLAYEIRLNIDSIQIYSEKIFSITNPSQSSYASELMETVNYNFGNDINTKTTLIFDGVAERIEENSAKAEKAKQKIIALLQRAILIILIFGLMITYFSIVNIARPIKEIAKAADFMAKGDYTKRIEIKTHNEIASLVDSFNQMSESIQRSHKKLENATIKAEESEEKLCQILDAFDDSIYISNPDYNIVYMNKALENLIGNDKIGTKCYQSIYNFNKECEWCLYDKLIENREYLAYDLYIPETGQYRYIRNIIFENNQKLTISQDITGRKKAEIELKKAKEKAEESDRLKSAFLANMSHEIQTPMNSILGFTELLLKPDLSSEKKESFIKIILQSGHRMLNTVSDIVEISKIEAGLIQLNLTKTDVNGRMEELFRFFQLEANKKGIKLSLQMLLPPADKNITTDQNKLDSILTNLIKNAIKYTDSGIIKMGCRQKDRFIEFFIKDTGIGIPKDRQEAIFERFIQADITDTRAFQGSGLGLAIAKSYVEMLGGNIWVESIEGEGSTFYFTLSTKNNNEEKSIEHSEVSSDFKKKKPNLKKLKILIAEDDETSRNYISLIVNDFSAEILEAGTGIEAVELCRNTKDLDLILMDIKMPRLDSYEATRRIREFNKEVIIIAQTAHDLSGDREKSMEAGCNDHIAKPINKDNLLALIKKYFGK